MGGSVPQEGELRIVTDGACRGNPGPGGWAALLRRGEEYEELGGHEPRTTNNRMELLAAVQGLRRARPGERVVIVTDSTYLIDGATKWVRGWKRNGWVTASDTPVEHRDLWEELDRLAAGRVRWQHVRGHRGHPENERANQLAQAHADRRPAGAPAPQAPARPAPAAARSGAAGWPAYLSFAKGALALDKTWDSCRARVHGVSGARYKKVASRAEAVAALEAWGVGASELDRLL